jgi:alkylation response protein AidB-like acyl-CoA dehydrogenase
MSVPGIYLELTDEQEFLVEAAEGVLSRQPTLESARAALDGEPAPSLWEIAVEAGWPGLLSAGEVDGAELGAYEAMLVLEACGARVADAGLLGHLPAAALVEAAGAGGVLRRGLASGEVRASLVDGELGDRPGSLIARAQGDAIVVDGTVTGVLDASHADTLVVVAVADGQPVAGVIAAADDTVTIEPQPAYDATRSRARVNMIRARANRLPLEAVRLRDGRDLQRALLAADSVGAATACLEMARDYAIDRHAFGRAIGSYQAIKHKLVEMMRRIEGARSLLVHAGWAWSSDRPEFGLAANAARVAAADALDYCAPENIFIHGGVGATWEHDAQLYYRRAELSRRLAAGAEAAADEVAAQLFAQAFA